jgi:hypothetical protein
MLRMQPVTPHWGWWALATLLAVASVPVLFLPVLRGGDVITWPSTLAADTALALAVLLVMLDARRLEPGAELARPVPRSRRNHVCISGRRDAL